MPVPADPARPSGVEVIVPVFDAAAHLGACVRSLARLEPRPDRVIVVDDHSHDHSGPLAMAALTAAGLPATLVTLPARQGPGAARNRGLAEARAPLVWFVDADDTVAPDALRILRAAIAGHDFAVCRTTLVDAEGTVTGIDEPPPPRAVLTGPEYATLLMRGQARAYAPTKMFRRDFLPDRPWDEVRRYEDLASAIALACAADTVALVAAAPYRYHRRPGSASATFDPHTFELSTLPDRALAPLVAAGAAPTRSESAAFVLRESVFPLAHLAMRADPGEDTARAIATARRRIRPADLIGLAASGRIRLALAALVLLAFPRCYAQILRTR
ncbi:glycosyltransferase family 2 protein [Nocardia flavorosea]|uniref:Glycosyltransferase family 2 protein n=1 Tax=Nocardia flavorosea TaxID=53429 RepID=A0A846YIP8_9NOCA|nr:glycosyltransferase family A protein [Nocardia flavorosea]NKY56998.1 glycosyltransferase family 2 protein [Nocardia flavorosea]